MNKALQILILTSLSLTSACSFGNQQDQVSPQTISALTGTWLNQDNTGHIRFYEDETAKLIFPKHEPAIKYIAAYEQLKEQTLGISLGGFWSGPVLIDFSQIKYAEITETFPDEQPIILHKKRAIK